MPQYFCRGCGKPLPSARLHFHPECLKADKARRVRERRERQDRILANRLGRLRCLQCGEPFTAPKRDSDVPQKSAREASQAGPDAPASPQ